MSERRGTGMSATEGLSLQAQERSDKTQAKPATERSERRGAVILIQRGDPEITGAIVEGMMAGRSVATAATSSVTASPCHLPQRGRLLKEQIEVVEAEIDRQKILADLVRVATGNRNTPEDYRILITKARGDYQRLTRPAGPLKRFARRALGLYGLVVYSVATMGRG